MRKSDFPADSDDTDSWQSAEVLEETRQVGRMSTDHARQDRMKLQMSTNYALEKPGSRMIGGAIVSPELLTTRIIECRARNCA